MNVIHSVMIVNDFRLHFIDFEPASFSESDILWLPHHMLLAKTSVKRRMEHLAGRMAAFEALQESGITEIPSPGHRGKPVWPEGVYGSISHRNSIAVAVVSLTNVGVDIEEEFTETLAKEVMGSIVTEAEENILAQSVIPWTLALTVVFSAKESLFKAFSHYAFNIPDFKSSTVIHIDSNKISLRFESSYSSELAGKVMTINWYERRGYIVTLFGE